MKRRELIKLIAASAAATAVPALAFAQEEIGPNGTAAFTARWIADSSMQRFWLASTWTEREIEGAAPDIVLREWHTPVGEVYTTKELIQREWHTPAGAVYMLLGSPWLLEREQRAVREHAEILWRQRRERDGQTNAR